MKGASRTAAADGTLQAGREPGLGRVRSLDGLRGLAALIVVEHHALLATVPWLAGPYGPGPLPARGSLDWLLVYTPLHIFWAGQEFVVVFFVLSGFVLSLPARAARACASPPTTPRASSACTCPCGVCSCSRPSCTSPSATARSPPGAGG